MDDLLAEFLTETNESLAELDVALVRLERNPGDTSTLSLVFRLVHTIKGTCGFLGLSRLERVAHAAEDVLGQVRDGSLAATPTIVSAVLAALDRIRGIVAALGEAGAEPQGDDAAVITRLRGCLDTGSPPPEAAIDVPPQPMATLSAAPVPQAAAPLPAAENPPAPAPAAPAPAPAAPAASEPAEPIRSEAGLPTTAQTIRVSVDLLETLMTLVSELVLTRNQLLQLARTQDHGREGSIFTTPLQRLSQITSDLQEGVMKTRMQPVGAAWNKLPRLVRDLAADLGKKIELVMTGADTELDRQVLELIRDPLTHMVRNGGDHGLEDPAGRRAAGKSETGRISLTAFHEGGHIVIEVSDDGRGLDAGRIRAKALAQGLATAAELETMSDAQLNRFIFAPGFSTAAKITAVSGRGVGMDVVKTNIERIGGTIELSSVPGQGSTFTIKIPLTLAIVSALIVEAAGQRFAVPQLSVVELVHAQAPGSAGGQAGAGEADSRIEMLRGAPVLRLRERLLPLISLQDLLQLEQPQGEPGGDESRTILVTQGGALTLGIIVDRVFDTEEIVVKPVAPILRHITMFSGNTILGDGSVVMILDPVGIARAAAAGAAEARASARPAAEKALAHMGQDLGERVTLLLFRVGGSLMAVPLGLVARLEDIPRERVEYMAPEGGVERPITQYRGRLMPLVPLAGSLDPNRESLPVLVFGDGAEGAEAERTVGLVVDAIVDVVNEPLRIELMGRTPGVLGTAVLAGRAAGVLDTRHWLTSVYPDWFSPAGGGVGSAARPRLLVVDDSGFFRQLVVPILEVAGFATTAVSTAAQALRLREAGAMFEVVISDIEMPDMDGLAFVRAVRAGGAWSHLPMIALSARAQPEHVQAGRDAGFTEYVAKFDQEALLDSVRRHVRSALNPSHA